MIRTFIAIDLSPAIKSALDTLIKKLKSHGSLPVRWTAAQNIHITLKFLGDIDERRLPELKTRLISAVQGVQPFSLQVGKLGAFPNANRARIIWVGCQLEPAGFLLQKSVEEATLEMGFPREKRPFSPHLTIGRVNTTSSSQDLAALARLIRETPVEWLGTQPVAGIRVYRSDLLPGGSRYTPLYDISLGITGQFMA